MQELPAIFVSHGAPDLVLSKEPARLALIELGKSLPRPRGIVIVSAHWQAPEFTLGDARQFATSYDFGGFPAPLYQLKYPAKSAEWLSRLCTETLQQQQIAFSHDQQHGLDHGAWIPLLLAWPAADIPVVALSLKLNATLRQDLDLGHALESLRHSGILVITSGAVTHNLGDLLAPGSPPAPWVNEFGSWVEDKLAHSATADLLNYRILAPHARHAHPTEEHFEPLLVAYAAGGEKTPTLLHRSYSYGNLAMEIYAFGAGQIGTELKERMNQQINAQAEQLKASA